LLEKEYRRYEMVGLLPEFLFERALIHWAWIRVRIERKKLEEMEKEEVRREAHRLFTTGRKLFTLGGAITEAHFGVELQLITFYPKLRLFAGCMLTILLGL
jgi:hypothetical protein